MADVFVPDWPAPSNVRALQTLRSGGQSSPPWESFNLGDHVTDALVDVESNRAGLRLLLPSEPYWLKQVHGNRVADIDGSEVTAEADAAFTRHSGKVCAVLTADCLPVLFCERSGSVVGAAHAGWRGLVSGVLEATIDAMNVPSSDLLVWLGPAIGPKYFEVGDEVRQAFVACDSFAVSAFEPHGPGKWLADIYKLARFRLAAAGVKSVSGGEFCTYAEQQRFFSYRRDRVTGRMASLIWLDS